MPEPKSTEAQASAAGLATPQNLDLLAQGDDAILRNARFTADALALAAAAAATADAALPRDTPGLPAAEPQADVLAAVTDAAGNLTDLTVRATDGQVPDWVMQRWAARLDRVLTGVSDADPRLPQIEPFANLLVALTDAAGNLTDLTVRATDGQVPDWVIQRWSARMGSAASRQYTDAPWTPGASVFPVLTDMSTWSGWGSSTMNGLQHRIRDAATAAGSTYYDGSQSGEVAENILARMGARPALLTFPANTVPASGAVAVTASNMPVPNALKTYSGTVAGVAGSLSWASGVLTFTRTTAGTAVPAPVDAPFLPDSGPLHRADFTVLNVGKNNLTGAAGADALVAELTWQAFSWLAPLQKRVIVPGHFINTNTAPGTTAHTQILAVNADYRTRYGPLYFDLQGYVTGAQVWTDTGITPTAEDTTAQAEGRKPPSLSSDDGHLNTAGRDAAANAIVAHASALGWI